MNHEKLPTKRLAIRVAALFPVAILAAEVMIFAKADLSSPIEIAVVRGVAIACVALSVAVVTGWLPVSKGNK